jgi:hypothetical protein
MPKSYKESAYLIYRFMEDLFSVVLPTMWRSPRIERVLKDLQDCELVHEVILIDNCVEARSVDIVSICPKARVFEQTQNIYVNPAWNLGVSEAVCELVAICSDDINFDAPDIFGWVKNNKDGLGCIGVHPESYSVSRQYIEYDNNYYTGGGGWGCLLFFKKSNWIHIPADLKIGYGDDWIAKTQKPHYSIKTRNKIETEMSTTVKSDKAFNPIMMRDIAVWKKIFG